MHQDLSQEISLLSDLLQPIFLFVSLYSVGLDASAHRSAEFR